MLLKVLVTIAEFSGLFPKGTLENRDITVITVSQKTENDMSMWSADVEDEREDLLQHVSVFLSAENIPNSRKLQSHITLFVSNIWCLHTKLASIISHLKKKTGI